MADVTLQGVTKRFGDVVAVDDLSVGIKHGEFFVVVGPTACGKTTLLRLIAGLLKPDSGEIYFDGEPVDHLRPAERGVRMVFQSYALYPHMKVFDRKRQSNLSFALMIHKFMPEKLIERVEAVARRIGIEKQLYARKPDQLSEGQKQKVAVGRAITLPPKMLLMDEPLSNLDPQSRLKSRTEIRKLHEELRATTVYVTHDLAEAFTLADTLAVMHRGKFVQIGRPREIYRNPVNRFVEEFVTSYEALIREAFDR
ncbi:MAG: ABC transporter ATP-binding protein [Candidatus Bipolaricaulia bacterium]